VRLTLEPGLEIFTFEDGYFGCACHVGGYEDVSSDVVDVSIAVDASDPKYDFAGALGL